ncbi:MAG: type IX secretion system protein PorQ [Bacteroidales bacterium]|nr:type IX secretion system protein PorQ [Bacteroidales bacterium]
MFAIILNSQFSILNSIQAQIAGLNDLPLLKRSSVARTNALGMRYMPLYSSDITVGLDNPSLLTSGMGNTAMLSYYSMFVGGNMGSLAYAHNFKHVGTVLFGFHFNSYGKFEEYDELENHIGDFYAADYAVSVGWGMWVDSNFSIGTTFKPVWSQYAEYKAVSLAIDLAGSYVSDNRHFAATLMANNIGAQIVTFDNKVESVPFELSAALSYKLSKAPFRFFFAATELQKWNLRYNDKLNPTTQVDAFTGEVTEEKPIVGFMDNLMRHTVFGVELNLGTALFARVGYNYRQAAEMRGTDAINLSGFSFGVGLHVKNFEFSYARRNYHLGQAPNYFTLSYHF